MSNCFWFCCSETQKDNQKASKALPLIWYPNHLFPTCCYKHQASKSTIWAGKDPSTTRFYSSPYFTFSPPQHFELLLLLQVSWVALRSHSLSFIKPPRRTSSFPSSSFCHSNNSISSFRNRSCFIHSNYLIPSTMMLLCSTVAELMKWKVRKQPKQKLFVRNFHGIARKAFSSG